MVAASVVMMIGTIGYYYFVGDEKYSWIDALYMTFITVATIGFAEIIDLSHNPYGRLFTVFIGMCGLATLWFLSASFTVFLIEIDLSLEWRRRRMERAIMKLQQHYIICGFGRVGRNVAEELEATGRKYVAVDEILEILQSQEEKKSDLLYLHGDASEDDTLIKADVADARGVFAVTGDDSKNLMISLSAKQLNPSVRVVARCHDMHNIEKMRKAGADMVVSPDFTGGMRIASAMIRPHVVSFLDEMLRTEHRLRIEEVMVPESFAPRRLDVLNLHSPDFVLLAVRSRNDWVFNPAADFVVRPGNILVAMAAPHGRQTIEASLALSQQ